MKPELAMAFACAAGKRSEIPCALSSNSVFSIA